MEQAAHVRARHLAGVGPAPVRMLLLSDGRSAQSEAQFDPIFRNLPVLRERFGLVVAREALDAGCPPSPHRLAGWDIIGFKLDYRTPPETVEAVARHLARSKPAASALVYCDGNDEMTVQWPGLFRHCDVYWKKHAFRDRRLYRRRFRGSTNLTEYALPPGEGAVQSAGGAFTPPPGDGDLQKLFVGSSVGLDRKIAALQPLLKSGSPVPPFAQRENDVILRADVPDNWMGNLRRPAAEVLAGLQGRLKILLPHGRVPPQQYAEEMLTSKICVSPFGYGEICWRDFEAVAYGCLLIKPDMGHVESRPDIFQPFKTYIPVAWDFSDLEQKLLHCLESPEECVQIVANARRVLAEALEPGWFAGVFGELLQASGNRTSQRPFPPQLHPRDE
ncbi:MAG: glycosyltransferase family 1 protein [Chthoniobacterales bacterium]|nr:glycosyltransferase family 1 protein [Chthoniobacterales bacterium]